MDSSSLFTSAAKQRIPISAQVEITRACNFRCPHCYVPQNDNEHMEFDDYKGYIKQLKDLGCRFMNITGGEPLIHPDFLELYTYTAKQGLITTVYTNGSMITPDVAALFQRYRPRFIEISLYGSTDLVYQAVTGRSQSFGPVVEGIKLLVTKGIPVRLKSFITKSNYHDFQQIRQLAESILGSAVGKETFKYDYKILPTLDGSIENQKLRLSPEEAVQLELSDGANHLERWKTRRKNDVYKKNSKMECGCGRYSFQIDVYGNVNVCTFHTLLGRSLKKDTFKDIWRSFGEALERFNGEKREPTECDSCQYSFLCDNCPAISYAEKKHKLGNSAVDYCCEIAKQRFEILIGHEQKAL